MTKKNQGICLLRIFLVAGVILRHFSQITGIISYYITFAVPVFMLVSFYFSGSILLNNNRDKIRKKMVRLFIPYYFWGVFYYLIFGIIMKKASVTDLVWQLLTGSSNVLNPPLWFLADQMVLLLFMYCIYSLNRNILRGNICAVIIACICIFLQYSGINYQTFDVLSWEIKWNLGRFCEVVPYAVIGILLYQVFPFLEKKTLKTKGAVSIVCFFVPIVLYRIYIPQGAGFGFEGINKILCATAIFIFFYNLPIYNIDFIEEISKYTLGIYCIHMLVGRGVKWGLLNTSIWIQDYLICILIFCFSLLISKAITLLPIKNINKIVC